MLNFTKDNLTAVSKEDVTANTTAIKVNDMVILLEGGTGGTDVSATTATAADVLEGKQFYNAYGTLTQGTLDDSYDVNEDLDSITTALYTVGGTTINITSAENIEDINVELDNLNTELLTIRGE